MTKLDDLKCLPVARSGIKTLSGVRAKFAETFDANRKFSKT